MKRTKSVRKPILKAVTEAAVKEKLSKEGKELTRVREVLSEFNVPEGRRRAMVGKELGALSFSTKSKVPGAFNRALTSYYVTTKQAGLDRKSADSILLTFAGFKKKEEEGQVIP